MSNHAPDRTGALAPLGYALLFLMGFGAEPLLAQFRIQTAPPAAPSLEARQSFQARIDQQAHALANEPRLKRVPAHKRQALVEFVVGNALFVAAHELGHALVAEMKLPALAGEEQLADDFAVLTVLKHGEKDFSDRVLIEAAKGWFTSVRRDKKAKAAPDYYDRHGFNERRAYRIVCLMVGADPMRFKALAEETKLPGDQQRRCGWEYDTAMRSWETVLTPHRRAPDQPKARIDVVYGDAGELAVYAQMFRALQFLETVAELAADRFAWRAPIVMEMRSCGSAGAGWIVSTRRLDICYEMARDFAEIYRDFGYDR